MKSNLHYRIGRLTFMFSLFSSVVFSQVTWTDVITDCGTTYDYSSSLAIQPDNKILQGGNTGSGPCIVRYNNPGYLDSTFGVGGKLFLPGLNGSDLNDIEFQGADKIVYGGSYNNGADVDFVLARFFDDGTTDSSFGTNGVFIKAIGSLNDYCNEIEFQSDGKIIAAGETNYLNGMGDVIQDVCLMRVDLNGAIDNNFGINGIITLPIGLARTHLNSMVIQPDDKILVGGEYFDSNFGFSDVYIARFNPNGTIDSNFGINGIVKTILNPYYDKIRSIALQSDGKIVVTGWSQINLSDPDFFLFRYNQDGSLDNTFGTNGFVRTDYGTDYAEGLIIQNDGRIVVSGYSQSHTEAIYKAVVLCYDNTGSLDPLFGTNGMIRIQLGQQDADVSAMCVDNNDQIVIGGTCRMASTDFDYTLIRLTSTPVGVENLQDNSFSAHLFPNPSADKINIIYTLEKNSKLSVFLIDGLGRVVQTFLNNEFRPAGNYSDGLEVMSNLPAGMYFIKIVSDENSKVIQWMKE